MAQADSLFTGACSIKIPDHELLRLIGRGSYGEVWLARNIMGTFRAVKIIRRSAFDSDSPFDREFAGLKKFEPISRTHSGFVDILQIGRNDTERCIYYVMEAADDIELGQAIDPDSYVPRTLGKALGRVKRFPVEQCVQMGLALCQALDHLHKQGLVHRDIKPSNIVFVNGVPKLADIGLVTESNNAHSFVGTEGFIPPEGPGGEQADIYSLGKALYEIASGRDRLDFPALPPGLSEFPDGEQFLELNECLIRACRLDRQRRYSSAREMYEDLALLASGKSLRRLRVLERRWQSVKRNTAVTAAALTVAAMIIWPILRERRHADEIRERQIGIRSANGIAKLDNGDLAGALGEFSEIFQLEARNKHRFPVHQTRVASILANTPRLTQMLFLENRVASVQFSADGRRLLAVQKFKRAAVHDLASASHIASVDAGGAVQAAFSPDNRLAVIADEDGWASIWDPQSGATRRLKHPANVLCAAFSPGGKRVATACRDGIVRIWDVDSEQPLIATRGHTNTIRSVAFSSDERLLVTASADFTARIWNTATGEQVGPALQHSGWVLDAAFNPDSTRVVTAGNDNWARVWKVSTGEELPTLMKHDDVVTHVAFSPDGAMIVTASNDATVRLWDSKTTMPVRRNHVLRHSSGVFSAAFNPQGHQIVTGCDDGTVRVWDLAGSDSEPELIHGTVDDTGSTVAVIAPNAILVSSLASAAQTNRAPVRGQVRELALSDQGRALAALVATSEDPKGTVNVWQFDPDTSSFTIEGLTDRVAGLKFSHDGSLLAVRTVSNNSASVRLFDARSGAHWPLPQGLNNNPAFAFHPNKRRVAIGAGGAIHIFEDFKDAPLFQQLSVAGNVRHLAFSPDGRRLIVTQSDGSISPKSSVLFDADTGKQIGPEFWHRDGILAAAFDPDGRRLVTAGEDREARIWNIASPNESSPPLLHRHQVQAVAFSPDGRWIGSASADGIVRVWDGETGYPLTPPFSCERSQSQVIFPPGALSFITIQNSTRAWLWRIPQTTMPPADAIALSHLLNSDLRFTGRPDTKQIAEIWTRVRTKFPDRFSTDKSQVAQWHARQHRVAQLQKNETALAFHADRLRALQLDSSSPSSSQAMDSSLAGKSP